MKNRKKMYTAASCTAVTVRLNKVKPTDWKVDCQGTFADKSDTLIIEAPLITKQRNYSKSSCVSRACKPLKLCRKNAQMIILKELVGKGLCDSSYGQADGIIPGVMLAKMKTVETSAALAEHLKTSVRVKDNFPKAKVTQKAKINNLTKNFRYPQKEKYLSANVKSNLLIIFFTTK